MSKPLALIVGVGDGLSASLARMLHAEGYQLALAARNTDKIAQLAKDTGATLHSCDSSQPAQVEQLFAALNGPLRVAIYNPSSRVRGPIAELDPEAVRTGIEITAFGSFLVGQQAARVMLEQGQGTILFTGATAGVKGFKHSASFAMGKFAQRGLSHSMSRELHPQNIHVAWVNIDGGIRGSKHEEPADRPESMLDPDAIAQTYLSLINQHRSAWSSEAEVRPWLETF
jgi:NAD(P)-dependent dehydrogenase (short-subunit alcohol dehydrogenase family)